MCGHRLCTGDSGENCMLCVDTDRVLVIVLRIVCCMWALILCIGDSAEKCMLCMDTSCVLVIVLGTVCCVDTNPVYW